MKLLYWFIPILLTISFNVQSQSFSMSDTNGIIINNGDTLFVSGSVTDQTLMANIRIVNNSSSAKTVKVRKTELSVVPGSANAFSWALLQYAPSVVVSQGNEIGSTVTDSSFVSFHFPNELTGISFIQYTFFDANNPVDSVWAVVEYNVLQVSGIAGINSSVISAFPNPINGVTTILSSTADVAMIPFYIRNSFGVVVYTAMLEKGKSSFDASGFPAGYYTIEAGNMRLKLMKQ